MSRWTSLLLVILATTLVYAVDTWDVKEEVTSYDVLETPVLKALVEAAEADPIVPPPTELSELSKCEESEGMCLHVAWDANTESDLAGYVVHRGRNKGDYNESFKVADLPDQWSNPACGPEYNPHKLECCEFTLINHEEGIYYYAATAYDKDNNESDYSDELVHYFHIHKPALSAPTDLVNKRDE